MKQSIYSEKAPAAIGPYSQAIEANGFIFVSGQLPVVPATGQFPSEDIQEQTKVYLEDVRDFGPMNEIYGQYFKEPYPARAAFAVAGLPKGAKVESEVIAAK